MPADWNELIGLTQSRPIVVERIRVVGSETRIEGDFSLPTLATLGAEDQVFVTAFIRSHGSIKRMEQLYGVSYPTIKNRLNRIAGQLEFVEIAVEPSDGDVIEAVERGEISVQEAIKRLEG